MRLNANIPVRPIQGFTLVETIMTMVIIGTLTAFFWRVWGRSAAQTDWIRELR